MSKTEMNNWNTVKNQLLFGKFKWTSYTLKMLETRAFENFKTANDSKFNSLKTYQMVCNFPVGKPLENGIVLEISLRKKMSEYGSSLTRIFDSVLIWECKGQRKPVFWHISRSKCGYLPMILFSQSLLTRKFHEM